MIQSPSQSALLTLRSPVFLARHGETVSNEARRYAGRSDEGLTTLGRLQAEELAARLAGQGVGEVRTSEIARAAETAEIVASALGVPLLRDRRLNEMLLGPWEGLTEDEVQQRYPDAYRVWNDRPDELVLDGRETLAQVAGRVWSVMTEAAARPSPTLLVTHVALMRTAALRTIGAPLCRYKRVSVPNAEVFRFDLARREAQRLDGMACLKQELALSGTGEAV